MRILFVIIIAISYSLFSCAQEREKIPLVDPLFRGVSVHVDAASPIMGLATALNIINIEMLADVNIYDRFFPVFELGYTSVNKEINNSSYFTQAPFFRLGMNFNIIKTANNKGIYKDNKNYAYLGVRYAFSMLAYELSNVEITNQYWETTHLRNYSNPFVYNGWAELHGGVRIDIAKGFTMGWSVGLKFLMHTSDNNSKMLWYIPGFGKNNPLNFAFKYTLGYTFRTPKAKQLIGTKIIADK